MNDNEVTVCACVGPIGDCPCDRRARKQPPVITESIISRDVFDCLSEEDKMTINNLKMKALSIYMRKSLP